MRDLAILTFQTLDGVMQAPRSPDEDRSGGFERGGWANPCWDEVMAQVRREAMAEPYDFLFGRKTYETFAAHRQATADQEPDAVGIDAARKYVVSASPDVPEWGRTEVLSGDVAKEVARIKAEEGPLLQVHGSWQLIQALLEHDLIDLYRIWTFPVFVGSGKRLFGAGGPPGDLVLEKTEGCPSGAVMHLYRRP
ncbi:MAG: dihydrofolate reductase family protein [Myxococcota bacterium]|nr:dihydrofolate reductase family protein [Myxococcota bacterium]